LFSKIQLIALVGAIHPNRLSHGLTRTAQAIEVNRRYQSPAGRFYLYKKTLNPIRDRPALSLFSFTKHVEHFLPQAYLIVSQTTWLNAQRKREKLPALP
jgi:hypothetical protein